MWIGLLWYFNFVATPTMPKIPDELKPALWQATSRRRRCSGSAGAPWARSCSASILAALNGYLLQAYTLDAIEGFSDLKTILIGIGMWLGTIMWFNVWFIIWPASRRC